MRNNYPNLFNSTTLINNSNPNGSESSTFEITPLPEPTNISLFYAINRRESSNSPIKSQTFVASIDNNSKQEVNVGYGYDAVDYTKQKYRFFTTKSGRYLVRDTQNSIEIASSSNITAFKTLVNCSCDIGSYVFSADETKLTYEVKQNGSNGYNLFITDLNGNKTEVKIPKPFEGAPQMIAFDSVNMKIAFGAGGWNSPAQPQIITIDANGNIIKTEMSEKWDFLDLFTNDFKYVYIQTYSWVYESGKSGRIIERYDLDTGQTDKILEIPENGGLTNFMLSPKGDKLTFLFESSQKKYIYIINLADNKVAKKEIDPSLAIICCNETWSPDGNYIYLGGYIHCSLNGECTEETEGNGYLYDLQTQEVNLYYKASGFDKKSKKNPSNSPTRESIEFIGWLAQ